MATELTEKDLMVVRDMCLEFYEEEEENIISIVLYGGAAKNFVGQEHSPGDFDLNIFFSSQADIPSTFGTPKKIGEYNGLTVEVMRNKITEDMSVQQYVEAQKSKRWNRIREEPVVQIHPAIQRVNWSS